MKAQEFHRLSIVTIALSLIISATIAIECLRRLNLQGVVHFVAKCKPNFNAIWDRHRAVVCKRNLVDVFFRLSTMHERDRQTYRQTSGHTVKPRNGNMECNRKSLVSDVA